MIAKVLVGLGTTAFLLANTNVRAGSGIGAAVLVSVFIIAILRGDLVPRKIHEEVKLDRDTYRAALKTITDREQEDRTDDERP